MPARARAAGAATSRCMEGKREEEDAPTEAEVLQFFDLFLEEGRHLGARQKQHERQQEEAADEVGDAASDDGGGWEQVQGQQEEDGDDDKNDDEDKESVSAASTISSGSDTSRSSSSVAISRSSASSRSSSSNFTRGRAASPGRGRGSKRAAETTKAAMPPLPPRRSSSTHYQHRQRQELEYLKGKVRELELRLRHLEREAVTAADESDGSMWQRVAQQQQVASQKAMAENAQLRAMISEQLKFSKSLEKAIRKRPLFGGHDDESSTRGAPSKRRQPLNAATLARSLRAWASHAHQLVERTLAESTVSGIMRDYHGFEIKARPDPMASANNQLRLEWVNARRLPFHFSAVAREIWHFLSDPSILEQSMPGMTRKIELWENELLATTDFVFPVGARSATLHATAAFRLTISSEFAHINWISHGECRAKKSAKDTFQIIEKGWTRIEQLPGSGDACIVRTVNYHTPLIVSVANRGDDADGKDAADDSSDSVSAEIGILTELICGAYDKSLGHLYAVIQNALMEQALREQGALK